MSKLANLAAAAALLAAALLSLATLASGAEAPDAQKRLVCAAALCGLVIF